MAPAMSRASPDAGGRTHLTFIELQTNRPLYAHRRGSNVANGEYHVDYDPRRTIAHATSLRNATPQRTTPQLCFAATAATFARRWRSSC